MIPRTRLGPGGGSRRPHEAGEGGQPPSLLTRARLPSTSYWRWISTWLLACWGAPSAGLESRGCAGCGARPAGLGRPAVTRHTLEADDTSSSGHPWPRQRRVAEVRDNQRSTSRPRSGNGRPSPQLGCAAGTPTRISSARVSTPRDDNFRPVVQKFLGTPAQWARSPHWCYRAAGRSRSLAASTRRCGVWDPSTGTPARRTAHPPHRRGGRGWRRCRCRTGDGRQSPPARTRRCGSGTCSPAPPLGGP